MSNVPILQQTPTPTFNANQHRLLFSVIVIILTIAAVFNLLDHYTLTKLDDSIEQGAIAFASVRSIHAIISVLQGTEISLPVLTLSVGEILSPATEILQSTSGVLTTALASLGLQRILLEVFTAKVVNITIALSAFAYLSTLWYQPLTHLRRYTQPLFFILCFTRFLLVATLLLNSAVDALFLNEQTEQITQQTDLIATDLHQFNQDLLKEKGASNEEDDSFLGSVKQTWHTVTDGLSDTKQEMQQNFEQLQSKTESLVVNLLTLIAMFVLKTILIPIGFLLLLKNLYWRLINRLPTI
ncbi:hypothetical protein A9264_04680 [Vibrio sp. UCD-FRSSP16_10]|uniref:hypothetical protein n=1 Tax=unclassified Vibrio TaxID=2614977 RepID=UPI0007FE133E|nr:MULTISPECIES: hypothetical protein [unclassified Vibrio]OBT08534.1 hypothetical protein A9260_06920 [Vibrio sp. UCD-FRSSP16_30]OBT18064.1 hypothetical protein A9264_04680 [Vibrio sp. UCD-FRSSP16_10]